MKPNNQHIDLSVKWAKLNSKTKFPKKQVKHMDIIVKLKIANWISLSYVNLIVEITIKELLTKCNDNYYKNLIIQKNYNVSNMEPQQKNHQNNFHCEIDDDSVFVLTSELQQIIKEYAYLANRSELSDSEGDRMEEILELSESNDLLSFFINEIDRFIEIKSKNNSLDEELNLDLTSVSELFHSEFQANHIEENYSEYYHWLNYYFPNAVKKFTEINSEKHISLNWSNLRLSYIDKFVYKLFKFALPKSLNLFEDITIVYSGGDDICIVMKIDLKNNNLDKSPSLINCHKLSYSLLNSIEKSLETLQIKSKDFNPYDIILERHNLYQLAESKLDILEIIKIWSTNSTSNGKASPGNTINENNTKRICNSTKKENLFLVNLPEKRNFKIAIIGSRGVGKSTLINAFIKDIATCNFNSKRFIDLPDIEDYKIDPLYLNYLNDCSVLALDSEVSNRSKKANTLNNLGQLYQDKGDYKKALQFYEEALAIIQTVNNDSNKVQILNNLGFVYSSFSHRYTQALEYLNQALSISRKKCNYFGEIITLNNIAIVYITKGDYDTALNFYQQALAISKEIDDDSNKAKILNHLGLVSCLMCQYPQALEYLEKALFISRNKCNRLREVIVLNNIGTIHKAKGDYEKSLKAYQEALAISQEIGNSTNSTSNKLKILNNLGLVYSHGSQYPQALEYLKQASSITQSQYNYSKQVNISKDTAIDCKNEKDYECDFENYHQTSDAKSYLAIQNLNRIIEKIINEYILEDFVDSCYNDNQLGEKLMTIEELFNSQNSIVKRVIVYVLTPHNLIDSNEQQYLRKLLEYQSSINKVNKIIFVLNTKEWSVKKDKFNEKFIKRLRERIAKIYQEYYSDIPLFFEVNPLKGTGINKFTEAIKQAITSDIANMKQLNQDRDDVIDNVNIQQKKIIIEYADLAGRLELSDTQANRISEILEISESDEVINLFINEIDQFTYQELNLLSQDNIEQYKDQIAKILELLEYKSTSQNNVVVEEILAIY